MLPRNLRRAPNHGSSSFRVPPLLAELAEAGPVVVLERLGSSYDGVSEEEAARRLARYGPNVVASDERHTRLRLLLRACLNPLVLLLAVLAIVSLATGDVRAAAVMTGMIVLGVSLRVAQEARADAAAEKLRAMIRLTATVLRAGRPVEGPLARLVPSALVHLCHGDRRAALRRRPQRRD